MNAPDLYPVTSAELAEELKCIDITGSMEWQGATIITGVHLRDGPRPVTIFKSNSANDMNLIALPDSD